MTQAEVGRELKELKRMIAEIHAALIQGQQVRPGRYEYDRAIKQFARGNRKPLEDFINKGGTPPGHDPESIPA
jgi:hypothetical protein